jgi:hypothetical protein
VANDRPAVLVEVHQNEYVSGDTHAVDELALAVLDLNDILHRHLDLEDVVLHGHGYPTVFDVLLDALFEAGVGVNDVPLARLGAQLRAECLVRVSGSRFLVVVVAQLGSVVRGDVGNLGGFFLRLDVGFVIGCGDRGIGLVQRVDLECVIDDRVSLGVDSCVEVVQKPGEIALGLVVNDVNGLVLCGVDGLHIGAQGVSLLRFVFF